jgi:hypothetical protein
VLKRGTPKSHRSFGHYIVAVEASWDIHCSEQEAKLVCTSVLGLTRQRSLLHTSKFSRKYDALDPPDAPCPYILRDSRPIAVLRARFRLNRQRFNASLFSRKMSPTPFCPICPDVPESTHHVLFDCPAHDLARHLLFAGLSACDCPTDIAIISGDVTKVAGGVRSEVLAISARFFQSVNKIRPI